MEFIAGHLILWLVLAILGFLGAILIQVWNMSSFLKAPNIEESISSIFGFKTVLVAISGLTGVVSGVLFLVACVAALV